VVSLSIKGCLDHISDNNGFVTSLIKAVAGEFETHSEKSGSPKIINVRAKQGMFPLLDLSWGIRPNEFRSVVFIAGWLPPAMPKIPRLHTIFYAKVARHRNY